MSNNILGLVLASFLLCLHTEAIAGDILIQDPWIREAPPTARVFAAYMVLQNTGSIEDALLEVSCPDFGSVEIHKTSMHQGKMQMQAIESLSIAAGEKVTLKPGGFHLMLFEPHKPIHLGEKCTLRFRFEHAADKEISVEVQKSH